MEMPVLYSELEFIDDGIEVPSNFASTFMWYSETGGVLDAEVMTVRMAYKMHLRHVKNQRKAGKFLTTAVNPSMFQFANKARIKNSVDEAKAVFASELRSMEDFHRTQLANIEIAMSKLNH